MTAILEGDGGGGALAGALRRAGAAPGSWTLERVPGRDWVAASLAGLPAVRAGRFVVRGGHAPARSRDDIRIEAGRAFGTGHHPTTRAALAALGRMALRRPRPRRCLDMGTGAGTLAIAMARTWRVPVVAVDSDPDAVACARANAAANGVARWIDVREGDGYRGLPAAAFDVAAANILAAPLRRMAGGLARALRPGGAAVLAGMLEGQWRAVALAHAARGLSVRAGARRDGWRALEARRGISRPAEGPRGRGGGGAR